MDLPHYHRPHNHQARRGVTTLHIALQ